MGGLVLLLGRIVFSFFFMYSGFNHLTKLSMYAQYAGASGVPAPTVLTAVSGVMLLAGASCWVSRRAGARCSSPRFSFRRRFLSTSFGESPIR